MHVLILGARAPACLEWARAFTASGWEVTVADSLHCPVTRTSSAVRRYVRLPEPRANPDVWISVLRKSVVSLEVNLVLPTCEEVFYLAYGMERLPCRVMTADLSLLHELHHKFRFANLTRGWSCCAPESHLIESITELSAFVDHADAWVFKPAYSRFANRMLIRPHRRQLARIKPSEAQPWLVQRFVGGREYCSYSLLSGGRVTAHACYHPRYRVGRGSGIWFDPVDLSNVQAFVEQFGRATGYSGQVAFDFIEAEEGQFYVLECNPRATSGVHLFDDQAQKLVQALLAENSQSEVLTPTARPRMVGLAMLFFAAPRFAWQKDFWQDFSAARDVIVRNDDWRPLLSQFPGLLEIVGRAMVRRRGLLSAATADIEWDGQPLGLTMPCD